MKKKARGFSGCFSNLEPKLKTTLRIPPFPFLTNFSALFFLSHCPFLLAFLPFSLFNLPCKMVQSLAAFLLTPFFISNLPLLMTRRPISLCPPHGLCPRVFHCLCQIPDFQPFSYCKVPSSTCEKNPIRTVVQGSRNCGCLHVLELSWHTRLMWQKPWDLKDAWLLVWKCMAKSGKLMFENKVFWFQVKGHERQLQVWLQRSWLLQAASFTCALVYLSLPFSLATLRPHLLKIEDGLVQPYFSRSEAPETIALVSTAAQACEALASSFPISSTSFHSLPFFFRVCKALSLSSCTCFLASAHSFSICFAYSSCRLMFTKMTLG